MPRNGKGHNFTLTEKRLVLACKLLRKQYSIRYAADKIGCDEVTLSGKLKELGIDPKQVKRDGIDTFKADMFATVLSIEEPEKKGKLMLDVLKQYDKSDDVASHGQVITFGEIK